MAPKISVTGRSANMLVESRSQRPGAIRIVSDVKNQFALQRIAVRRNDLETPRPARGADSLLDLLRGHGITEILPVPQRS